MNAARTLKAAIERSGRGHRPEPITEEFAQAVAHKLESRGIATVDDLPGPANHLEWFDLAIEMHNRNVAFQKERDARRKAEEEAHNAPQTTAGLLAAAIHGERGSAGTMPLNGASVLRAALNGGSGTINGSAT